MPTRKAMCNKCHRTYEGDDAYEQALRCERQKMPSPKYKPRKKIGDFTILSLSGIVWVSTGEKHASGGHRWQYNVHNDKYGYDERATEEVITRSAVERD